MIRSTNLLQAAPDLVEPVVAWRVWRLVAASHEYRLASVYKWTLWEPGSPLEACCHVPSSMLGKLLGRRDHASPAMECACGIHAAGLELVCDSLGTFGGGGVGMIVGQVVLWGDVVECEHGFRGALAYPRHLYVPLDTLASTRGAVAAQLAAYGVPVDVLASDFASAGAELQRRASMEM
jgi:hypothetical protein